LKIKSWRPGRSYHWWQNIPA